MNLHLTGRTAEQNAGPVLSDAIVGGWRLVLARTDAEAHLWHQRTRAGAVALKGGAVAVAQEEVFVGLQRMGRARTKITESSAIRLYPISRSKQDVTITVKS